MSTGSEDRPTPNPFVVGVCYPSEWWAEPGAFDAAVAALAATPRADGGSVEVLAVPYEEAHERRSDRGSDQERDWAADQPEISADTRAGLSRLHAALALDLPADITSIAPDLEWVQAFGAGSDQLRSCGFALSLIHI